MRKSPSIKMIKQWLIDKNPFNAFTHNTNFEIKDIDPKSWSGHFNFLVTTEQRRFVLRLKGPEWGEPTKGVLDEYKILKFVERYKTGPMVYYLNKNFFGEPMILEEYLEGKLLNKISEEKQKKLFPEVVKFIAKLNRIPVIKNALPFREPMLSYKKNLISWQQRLKIILSNIKTRELGKKIEKLMPKAEKMLQSFEPRLRRIIRTNGLAFIFESAHIGHCMKMKDGFRFLNWEQISYGDPSYTLAVFFASISSRPDFIEIKEMLIKEYLKFNPLPEFTELIEQRLKEREISNLIWVLWTYVDRKDTRPVEKITNVAERMRSIENILNQY